MTKKSRVEFRGRLVASTYPTRHAKAQQLTSYADFADGEARQRIPYGDARDRYPGGITYATREQRITFRIKSRKDSLARIDEIAKFRNQSLDEAFAYIDAIYPHHDNPDDYIEKDEVIRTDHRCPDCDVEVGELHLPGCHVENCPKCGWQAISCACAHAITKNVVEAVRRFE